MREQMSLVVVGHVDHGKSTVIGRLLADTGALPHGKLEQVKRTCERNAKPFEYAFLLDALKDEQAQGITIDSARCFFKTAKRDYIIIDAPGHVEFLKNMISGAARAEAAMLVIDAHEGIKENSKRHGYLLSMLGVDQVVVLVNKMDLVEYREHAFAAIVREYGEFLGCIQVKPLAFIPVSARHGENLSAFAPTMPWYKGKTVLEQVDDLVKGRDPREKPFRFPVQDVYKFTEAGDDRRVFAGTIESGSVTVGDPVVFYPSKKATVLASIEAFHRPQLAVASSGEAIGFTFKDELYVRPGEILCKANEPAPQTASRFRVNLFWMGRSPMVMDRKYKFKLATARGLVRLVKVNATLDATELTTVANKRQVDRHDIAECILETTKPVAGDLVSEISATGRLVIIDHYEIAGGGVILSTVSGEESLLTDHVRKREMLWQRGLVTPEERETRFGHRPRFVVFVGEDCGRIARQLEARLFKANYLTYYLGMENLSRGLDADVYDPLEVREEGVRRLGELARIMTDSGQIFIAAVGEVDKYDLAILKSLNAPNDFLLVRVGNPEALPEFKADLEIQPGDDREAAVDCVVERLRRERIIPEYSI